MSALYVLADAVSNITAPESPATGGLTQQQIILDAVVFIVGVVVLGGLLFIIARRIFTDKE